MKNVGQPIGKEILENINPFEDNVNKIVEYVNSLIEKYKGDLKQDGKLVLNSPCRYDFGKQDDLVRLILNFRSSEIEEAFKRFYNESGFAVYLKIETLLISLNANDLFEEYFEEGYKFDKLRVYLNRKVSSNPVYFQNNLSVLEKEFYISGKEIRTERNGKECLYRILTDENNFFKCKLKPINKNAIKEAKKDGVMKLNIWDKIFGI